MVFRRKIFAKYLILLFTKDANKGTGLGLATVDQLLRKMKGGVDVQSILRQGTKFTLYIRRTAHSSEVWRLMRRLRKDALV